MRVKELIQKLKEFDGDDFVVVGSKNSHRLAIEVKRIKAGVIRIMREFKE